jgi:hypothetical protein
MDFLKDQFGGEDKPAVSRPEEPGHAEQKRTEEGGSLFDKIGGALGGQQKTPAHQEDAGPGGLMGKLHGALGGGAKGEEKEDHLDKGSSIPSIHE